MAKPILIDLNVLIDVLSKRELFYATSQAVWDAHKSGWIDGYVTAVSLTNLFYITSNISGREAAWKGVRACLKTFTVCNTTFKILNLATEMSGKDFEDNVQMASAYAYKLEAIVTRDKSGFLDSVIPVLSPEELLAQINANGE